MTVTDKAKETGKAIGMSLWHIVAALVGIAIIIAAFTHANDIMTGIDKLVDLIFSKMNF